MPAGQGQQEGQSRRQSVTITSLFWVEPDCLPSLGLGENGYGKLTNDSWERSGLWRSQIGKERKDPGSSGKVFKAGDHKLVRQRRVLACMMGKTALVR